jgi:hypothetical protein
MANSGFSLYPCTVVPAPYLGFVQVKGSQSFSIGWKGLGMDEGMKFGGQFSWAMDLHKNLEKETGTL